MIIEIDGLQVKFPFEPYQLQRDYMAKVIDALNNKQNAVLESPTGEKKIKNLKMSFASFVNQYFISNQEPAKLCVFSPAHCPGSRKIKLRYD